ncbi:N-acetylmuramoyl-L-alanine amidase [candidate division KSB1 bacterium]
MVLYADFLFTPEDNPLNTENLYGGPSLASADLNIINRKSWAADENLRYWSPELEEKFKGKKTNFADLCADFNERYKSEVELSRVIKLGPAGEQLVWPLAYSKKIRKFVIHHTDSELKDLNGDHRMDGRDYTAMIRAIYHYHAITRGWGDIGYNFIIDPLGNIYEGRYGGAKVIGAHAQCYNNGSIGIAIIGDYEKNKVPEPALNSLISLIAYQAKLQNIDPQGESMFRGRKLKNVIGHRDVRSTACPGMRLYSLLQKIRERASLTMRSGVFTETTISTQTLDYDAEPLSSVDTIVLPPNQRTQLTLRFKNIGKKTWDRNTWMHVALNNKENARVVPVIEDKSFVAADMRESSVAPGQTATFEVELESGYFAGNYTFEVAPVVNGRYKVSRAAVFIPLQIEGPSFDYQVVKQDLPSGIIFQGQKIEASIKLKNTGNVKWVNYGDRPIRIGTEGPRDRNSSLIKKDASRLAYLLESEVEPGDTGTFIFNLEAPSSFEGLIKERFTPVIENVSWLEYKNLGFEVIVRKPSHAARITNKTKVPSLLPGEMKKIQMTFQNLGDIAWDQDNMKINLIGRGITLFKKSLKPLTSVKPKEEIDFDFWIQAPYEEGRHKITLRPIINRRTIRGGSARFLINVPKPTLRAQMVEQTERSISLNPGEEKELEVKFKNLGNVVWYNKGTYTVHLATSRPQDRSSRLYYKEGWINKYRAATMVESMVIPGEVGTFRFKVKPNRKGIYRENFQLVIEQVGWLEGAFVRWDFKVFGDKVNTSISQSRDSLQNKERAAIITSAKQEIERREINETQGNTQADNNNTPEPEQQFRVKLSYSDDNSKITANKSFRVIDQNEKNLFDVGAGTQIELRRLHSSIHVQLGSSVKNASSIRIVPEEGGVVEILTMERRPSWNTKLNDNKFRGIIEVRVINNQTTYINELPLEEYLNGLAEVSNGALFEKQKTIAVLARTYARFYMDDNNRKFPGLPYDGSDDPDIFQRYLGYGVEIRSPNFVGAVAATKNQVVTYNGKLIKTPYFNQSDGKTRSALEVWGWTNTPYLQSVPDPYCEGLYKRGHGVGLSGVGAEGMAKDGKGYEEIIKYYYQGIEIEKFDF